MTTRLFIQFTSNTGTTTMFGRFDHSPLPWPFSIPATGLRTGRPFSPRRPLTVLRTKSYTTRFGCQITSSTFSATIFCVSDDCSFSFLGPYSTFFWAGCPLAPRRPLTVHLENKRKIFISTKAIYNRQAFWNYLNKTNQIFIDYNFKFIIAYLNAVLN